jgi:hypothetical protein
MYCFEKYLHGLLGYMQKWGGSNILYLSKEGLAKIAEQVNRFFYSSELKQEKGELVDNQHVLSQPLWLKPENYENRNDPDLVQAFLKKWWAESDFKAPNLPLSLRFKGSGCHYNSRLQVFIYTHYQHTPECTNLLSVEQQRSSSYF